MQNTYRVMFSRVCPNNRQVIAYRLRITTPNTIMAEDIRATITALPAEGYHEGFADLLAAALPGRQVLKAHHHGVDIETERGGT